MRGFGEPATKALREIFVQIELAGLPVFSIDFVKIDESALQNRPLITEQPIHEALMGKVIRLRPGSIAVSAENLGILDRLGIRPLNLCRFAAAKMNGTGVTQVWASAIGAHNIRLLESVFAGACRRTADPTDLNRLVHNRRKHQDLALRISRTRARAIKVL